MARVIEKKQQELEGMAQKMQLPIDTDILRMRLAKDLEAKYRFELESKMQQLERTTDSLYETKRQLELVKTAYETSKIENERFIVDLRQRFKQEIDQIVEENHSLQLRVDEQGDQEAIRKYKRDADDQKRRLTES